MALDDARETSSGEESADRPLVSIVIPCYNHSRFLREAVDSALAQTYDRVEVVVVDDGSTDETLEVAGSYDGRIVVVAQENSGLSAARNAGVRASTGAIVMFLDADDSLDPDCVSARVPLFLSEPRVGMVAGGVRLVDESGGPLPGLPAPSAAPAHPRPSLYVREWWSPTPGLMIRRRALEVCGLFDPLLRACEDYDMQIRVTRRFLHAYDPTPRANYRQVAGSMSRNHLVMIDSLVRVFRKNRAYAAGSARYALDASVGFFNQVCGSVFGKLLREYPLGQRPRVLARLVVQRPILAPVVAAWGLRFGWNRVLWVFGTGPLRDGRAGRVG